MKCLACDLGAESGRVILGELSGGRLEMREVHRFPNRALVLRGNYKWNVPGLYDNLLHGLKKAASESGRIDSMSADSWGVDYAYSNAEETMLGLPFQYRDPRTGPYYDATRERASLIFEESGIQMMAINTLYQMLADRDLRPGVMGAADVFLPMGDYMNFLFSGRPVAEESLASTTQLYNPRERRWSRRLIETFELPERIFPEVVYSGTILGELENSAAQETGLNGLKVVAGCSHDTAAAVAAVPAEGNDWAYLSSGTWSLIGLELDAPLINDAVREANFTNEIGYGGTIRFLKNIIGLWILQECRREWSAGGEELDYGRLVEMAGEAEAFRSLINPNDARFMQPGGMPDKVRTFCEETGQPVPDSRPRMVRCILESLALLYAETLDQLEQLSGKSIRRLHIVGGGSRNELLNQLTADVSGREVVAGPVEATAIGNLLVQAAAQGGLATEGVEGIREVVRATTQPVSSQSRKEGDAREVRKRFRDLCLASR